MSRSVSPIFLTLPVESNASTRAKELPISHGIIQGDEQLTGVEKVLGAAAWTYVAGPLSAIGVWLFYVQHQFEQTRWARDDSWTRHEVALHGSSYYVLPGILRWFTANIGVHHVHHLCSQIPYYRLPRVLREHPELGDIGRLTLWQSIKCVRLVLWDESREKLISFREMRKSLIAGQPA